MATITLPSSTAWRDVTPTHTRFAGEKTSPYTGATTQQDWGVETQTFEFTVPPCKQTTGLLWAEALRELAIPGNTFVANVTSYVGTGTADKSSMTLRLIRGSVRHYVDRAKVHSISFTATKNL